MNYLLQVIGGLTLVVLAVIIVIGVAGGWLFLIHTNSDDLRRLAKLTDADIEAIKRLR